MYDHNQPIDYSGQYSGGATVKNTTVSAVPVESVDASNEIPYRQQHVFGEADAMASFDGVEAGVSATDAVVSYDVVQQCGNAGDQLTLSFGGQVYVFDSVSAEKVQKVLLILGGCELPSSPQPADIAYRNPQVNCVKEYPPRCTDPERAASLRRFYQKKQNRCFEKKIRYDVRREVAVRMHRKKGQFTSKTSENSTLVNAEDSRQDGTSQETMCKHCGTSSECTPMMRKGPDGPRTLCNACGLYWAQKGTLKNIPKRSRDHPLTQIEQGEVNKSNFGNAVYTH